MGVMQLGDPNLRRGGQSIAAGISQHSFRCDASSTALWPNALNVLYTQLHMHQSGIAMETRIDGSDNQWETFSYAKNWCAPMDHS